MPYSVITAQQACSNEMVKTVREVWYRIERMTDGTLTWARYSVVSPFQHQVGDEISLTGMSLQLKTRAQLYFSHYHGKCQGRNDTVPPRYDTYRDTWVAIRYVARYLLKMD